MKKMILSPVILALLGSMAGAATVDLTRNSAKAGGTRLKAGSRLADGADIATGSKSKLQLSVGDRGGVYRAGSMTDAVLTSEKSLSLKKGILLSSSGGSGVSRESLSVETPEVRSTVKGTMLIAYQPKAYIKITCLEGRVSVRLKAALGEFVDLKAGQMVIINPADKGLPEAVEVDLKELAATSTLLSEEFPALSSSAAFALAVNRQGNAVRGGDLAATNLRLSGAGLTVSVEAGIEGQRSEPPPKNVAAPSGQDRDDDDDDGLPPIPPPTETPVKKGYIIDETTVFNPPVLQTPGLAAIQGIAVGSVTASPLGENSPQTLEGSSLSGTVYSFTDADTPFRPSLLIRNQVTIPVSLYGTTYSAKGTLQVGDGNSTVVRTQDILTLLAAHLRVEKSTVQAGAGLAGRADTVLVSDSAWTSAGYTALGAEKNLSIEKSRIQGADTGIYSLGPLSVTGSNISGTNGVSIDYEGLDSDVLTISGSTVTSAMDDVLISSSAINPEMDSIVVNDASLEANGYVAIEGSGHRGGVRFANSSATGKEFVNIQTGNPSGTEDAGTITVDKSTLRSSNGGVTLKNHGNSSSRTGIRVQNSSQLLALASSGSVQLTTNGSQIYVADSTLTTGASGQILIDAMAGSSSVDTLVQLNSITASADIIRARSFNSGDRDSLVINGGRYDAASALKFYAEGASKLRFTGNVALNTPNADLAGKIVQVDAGGMVTGSGNINVYSDDHRYNNSSYGTIRSTSTNSTSLKSGRFADRPGF